MSAQAEPNRHVVDRRNLPPQFPTHAHSPEFWQALGRVIGTFGFLEEILGKAIFAFTAMRTIAPERANEEVERWLITLKRTLSDPLGGLINRYCKAVRDYGGSALSNFDDLERGLRDAKDIRNALCHGSWRNKPDVNGGSIPFFVNTKQEVFQTAIGTDDLEQVRRFAVGLVCGVMDSVTGMGWQFPGSNGPGITIGTDHV